MVSNEMTDMELSERVCRALGIEPRREWVVGPDKGSIRMKFGSYEVASDWLFDKHSHGLHIDCNVYQSDIYPNILDWAGFGRVVERLRELNVYVSTYVHPDTLEVEVVPVKGCYHGEDEKSLPRALALAVLEWESSR